MCEYSERARFAFIKTNSLVGAQSGATEVVGGEGLLLLLRTCKKFTLYTHHIASLVTVRGTNT